ncbi:hypothetical protein VTJ04DRAFT_3544 [Mycothermus thermophilus]|uniref:uncharacterized protein n=1 Tax=Humicola insolens TaxID=85995 RepID=UPI003743E83A
MDTLSSAPAPTDTVESTISGMFKSHAPGTCPADPSKPSLADLPYELQAAIFEAAAAGPQVVFVDIANNKLTFTPPADQVLARVCRLSREIYLKDKVLRRVGDHIFWLDSDRDIFYIRSDDPVPRVHRAHTVYDMPRLQWHGPFDKKLVRNVGVDLHYLGDFPRHDAIIRIWSVFPYLNAIHVFVPKGPPRTPAPPATPETLVLSRIPCAQVVAAPGRDKEMWLAVRYQVRKVCDRIMNGEHSPDPRPIPKVIGHFTSLLDNGSSGGGGDPQNDSDQQDVSTV